ncbi:hypothetical protein BDN71DRAFT_1428358 [Pleurotus eryngii]|uniref:Retroviral polymerase SH3-like domain-containing protein n=1 Tax=Pleurotus eryngii TaxID=5323 RepID=A0A9P6A4Q6_PLEER|nr:hypothetical protein BDN71DRAFT_1428358 [Pleurotus eryngii]
MATAAEECVELEDLHCHHSHISHDAACCLVTHGFVTGLILEPGSDGDFFCKFSHKDDQCFLPKSLWGEAAHHAVYLMNHTTTKAVPGMTPYEAAFRRKPDLKDLRVWGETAYIPTEGGDKLGGCVVKGHWVRFDDTSKGHNIYWPDCHTVTTKRNVYFNNTPDGCQAEGEEDAPAGAPKVSSSPSNDTSQDLPTNPQPSIPILDDINPQPPAPIIDCNSTPPLVEELLAKHIHKLSKVVWDLLDGLGCMSNCLSDPIVVKGVHIQEPLKPDTEKAVLEGEGTLQRCQMQRVLSQETWRKLITIQTGHYGRRLFKKNYAPWSPPALGFSWIALKMRT